MPLKLGPMELIIILFIIPFYLLPTIIAVVRHHPNILPIVLINILLGWTFLGWVGALIWSVWQFNGNVPSNVPISNNTARKNNNALAIAEERFARGEITSDEFDKIKSRLL